MQALVLVSVFRRQTRERLIEWLEWALPARVPLLWDRLGYTRTPAQMLHAAVVGKIRGFQAGVARRQAAAQLDRRCGRPGRGLRSCGGAAEPSVREHVRGPGCDACGRRGRAAGERARPRGVPTGGAVAMRRGARAAARARARQVVPGPAGGQLQERARAARVCVGLRAGGGRRVRVGLHRVPHDRPLPDVLRGAVRAEPGHVRAQPAAAGRGGEAAPAAVGRGARGRPRGSGARRRLLVLPGAPGGPGRAWAERTTHT